MIQESILLQSENRTSLYYGLVDAYTFDSGAQTSTGSGHNGTVSGATPVPGKIGNAYAFTGNNHIAVGDVSSYSFFHQTAQYAISLWFKLDNYQENYVGLLFSNNGTTTVQSGISLHYENRSVQAPDRSFRLNLTRGIHDQPVYFSEMPRYLLTDNDWHHIVVSGHGADLAYFYFDGVRYELVLQKKYGLGTGSASNTFIIGNINTSLSWPIKGGIDNLLIYNRPLSDLEVSDLYNGGAGVQYPFV